MVWFILPIIEPSNLEIYGAIKENTKDYSISIPENTSIFCMRIGLI